MTVRLPARGPLLPAAVLVGLATGPATGPARAQGHMPMPMPTPAPAPIGMPAAAPAAAAASAPAGATSKVPPQTMLHLLLAQVRFWQDKGDPVRAAQALDQADRIAPGDPLVTAAHGQLAIARGDADGANRALQTLSRSAPGSAQMLDLQQAIQNHSVSPDRLQALRAQAASADPATRERAAKGYQEAFGQRPTDGIALEYYQALSGTASGWQTARTGLSDLAARDPSDRAVQLALAQTLTYHEDTRLLGIARLRALATGNDPVGAAAVASLRQALLWLPADTGSLPELSRYAQSHPADADVAARLRQSEGAGAADPAGDDRQQGFAALAAGRLDQADAAFRSALALNPHDPDALGGMGLLRGRQGRTAESKDLLGQAITADPTHAARWQPALQGLSVGDAYEEARALIRRGRYAEAEPKVRALIAAATDPTGAMLMLADLQVRAGRDAAAAATYRGVLADRPDDADALLGLARIDARQGRDDEMHALLDRLGGRRNAEARQLIEGDQRVVALRQADAADAGADRISVLRDAVARDGGDPWLRLRLAQALLADGQAAQARAAMAPLADTRDIDALRAGIIFAGQSDDLDTAGALLARLPTRAATPDTRAVAARVAFAGQIASARADDDGTHTALLALARRPDPTGARGVRIAATLRELGDRRGAARALRLAAAATPAPTPGQLLAYAGAYLELGDTAGARAALTALDQGGAAGSLTEDQRAARRQVEQGLAVVASDRLDGSGDRAAAYDQLAPVLRDAPDAVAPRLALARLYTSDRQPQKALALDMAVLQAAPADLDARLAAVRAAVDCGELAQADGLARDALVTAPDDPRSWLATAAVARGRGNPRMALDALRRAAALRRQQLGGDAQAPFGIAAVDMPAPDDGNPFRQTAARASGEPTPGDAPPATPAEAAPGSQDAMLAAIDAEIAQVHDASAPSFDVNVAVRSRSGQGGLDSLTQFSVPLTATLPVGNGAAHWWAAVTPTVVSSGSLDGTVQTQDLFGTLARGGVSGFDGASDQSGVALQAGYANRWLAADAGTTPLGFRVANVVGGLEVSPQIGRDVTLRLTGERRAVTDSVLAYGGLRDPGTGTTWGGVTRDRGHAQIEIARGTAVLYAGAGYALLDGQHVRSNNEAEAGLGGSVQVWQGDGQTIRVGLDLDYFGYDRNLRFFTLGQGGYFSPQSYVSASVPVVWAGRSGPWDWDATGAIGYQSYNEHGSPYYPDDPSLQAALAATGDVATHPGQTQSGVVGRADGRVEYAVSPGLKIGARGSYQRTGNWNEGQVMLTARYTAAQTP